MMAILYLWTRNIDVLLFVLTFLLLTINTVKFLTTTIPTLKHSTATPIENENCETMWDALRPTLLKYQAAGCVIADFRGDGGFKCLKDVILAQGVGVANITSRDEHEPHIERFNRTLEERSAVCYARL